MTLVEMATTIANDLKLGPDSRQELIEVAGRGLEAVRARASEMQKEHDALGIGGGGARGRLTAAFGSLLLAATDAEASFDPVSDHEARVEGRLAEVAAQNERYRAYMALKAKVSELAREDPGSPEALAARTELEEARKARAWE